MKKKAARYQVVNANGQLIKFFGAYKEAVHFAHHHDRAGSAYGLKVKRYYVEIDSPAKTA